MLLINFSKKMMNKIIITLLLSFLSLSIFGQELKISNGKTQKSFKADAPLEVIITDTNTIYKNGYCCNNYTELQGTITAIEKDSIVFLVNNLQNFRSMNEAYIGDYYQTPENSTGINTKVAISNIKSIRKYKSLKSKKRKGTLTGLAGLSVSIGLITSLNALLVKDKKNRRNILILGAAQVGLGITFGSLSHAKNYDFRAKENPWVIQQ